ncbi:MAG: hypothetical protein ACFFAN_13250 [Promethearchaeota archaeon]
MIESDKQISSISDENKIDFLRKNWFSHDARWQMEVVKNFGWEAGNKMNQAVIKDIGKVMMFRMMKIQGISEVSHINELRNLMLSIATLNFPPPINVYQLDRVSNSSLCVKCQKCSTHDNVKKVGATKFYECGCFSIRKGFCDALNLTLEQELESCLMNGDEECKIILKIKEWENLKDEA